MKWQQPGGDRSTAPTETATAPTDPMLELALHHARIGRYVCPLQRGGKKPHRGSQGFKDATRDEPTIRHMWAAHPGSNVGCVPEMSGEFVVDLAVKHGEDGPGNWANLVANIEHPAGLVVRTPSGGLHLWWRGTSPTNAGEVGKGIDLRGLGGYAVLPGSRLVEVIKPDRSIEQHAGTYTEDPERPLEAPENSPAAPEPS